MGGCGTEFAIYFIDFVKMLFNDTYTTIENNTEYRYVSKGSKFLAYVYRVSDETEIKEKLARLRQHYPDATHHCYAYVLGHDRSNFRANDDGEPSGTAGRPILRQIQKLELTNVLVVVVRYFGGTLLGVPGLIEAYGTAAAECLKLCERKTNTIREIYTITCPFGDEKDIYRICKLFHLNPRPDNDSGCFSAEIRIPLHQVATFKEALKEHYRINIKYTGIE